MFSLLDIILIVIILILISVVLHFRLLRNEYIMLYNKSVDILNSYLKQYSQLQDTVLTLQNKLLQAQNDYIELIEMVDKADIKFNKMEKNNE